MARAFWWDREAGEEIGSIFPDTEGGRRMHRLFLRCLNATYGSRHPPVGEVIDAALEVGHGEEEALRLVECAYLQKAERDERHRAHVEAMTGLPFVEALRRYLQS